MGLLTWRCFDKIMNKTWKIFSWTLTMSFPSSILSLLRLLNKQREISLCVKRQLIDLNQKTQTLTVFTSKWSSRVNNLEIGNYICNITSASLLQLKFCDLKRKTHLKRQDFNSETVTFSRLSSNCNSAIWKVNNLNIWLEFARKLLQVFNIKSAHFSKCVEL